MSQQPRRSAVLHPEQSSRDVWRWSLQESGRPYVFVAAASRYGWRDNNARGLEYVKTLTVADVQPGAWLKADLSWSKRLRGGFTATMILDQGGANSEADRPQYVNNLYVFSLSVDATLILTPPR